MKQLLFLLFSLSQFTLVAQCTNCLSIQEALKFPDKIVQLNLRHSPVLSLDSVVNNFSKLQEIDLSYSFVRSFDGNVLLPNVSKVNLSHSNLSPWTLESLDKNFPHLKELDLNSASLHFVPNKLANLSELTTLDLSNNKLTSLPASLEQLQKLKSLDLSNNDLKSQLNILGYLWNLEKLDLSRNPQLNLNNVLVAVSENENLKELSIDASALSKEGGRLIGKSNIETLVLNDLSIKNTKYLRSLPSVKELVIQNSLLQDAPSLSSKFPNLKHLVLENSTVSSQTFDQISIDQLTLKGTNPVLASYFQTARKINVLDVSECEISESELIQLKSLLPKTKIIANTYGVIAETKNEQSSIVKVEVQKQTISADEPTIITEKNARFEIPQNAFLTTDGSVYSGKVNVEVKVYEDALELLLDGAPMTYTKDGVPELFGSNAMLYFNATTENGEQLAPNPNAVISVEMRNNIPDTLGDFYLYNETQQNWQPIPNTPVQEINTGERLRRITDSINAIDAKTLYNTLNNDRRYSLKVKTSKYDQTLLNFDSEFDPLKSDYRTVYYNRFSNAGKELCKYQWAVDTVVNTEMRKLLKTIQKETKVKYRNLKKKTKPYIPKKIWNMSIVQDYDADQYRLKFNFKDSVIELPVAITGTSTNKIQKQHKQFSTKLANAEKKDERVKKQFDKYLKSHIDETIEEVRQNLIIQVISGSGSERPNSNRIRFGLFLFGLLNWDIIIRPRPIDTYVLENTFQDQNGNVFKSPENVQVLMVNQNSYQNFNRKSIPIYENSILIIQLENKIGVLPIKKNKKKSFSVLTVFDISNMSSSDVSKLIRSQNAPN